MRTIECEGINTFLILASKLLMEYGVPRKVSHEICWEYPEPCCFKITNPYARWIIISERKWNIFLAYAESLWIASGRNDLDMIEHYLPKMRNFSDDGITIRGGYGPRIRSFNNSYKDYSVNNIAPSVLHDNSPDIDQLRFVIKCFEEDINTRRAVIQIGDPIKDCFDSSHEKKITKDFPCTRTLHFMKESSSLRLNLIVHMRSNDLIWGASGVNIFNFTFLQEYVARIVGLEMGSYYHIVDNIHFYDKYREKIVAISKAKIKREPRFKYPSTRLNLSDFNLKVVALSQWEEAIRKGSINRKAQFGDAFFDDWAGVLYCFHKNNFSEFRNPILRFIISRRRLCHE